MAEQNINVASLGMNLSSSINQVKKGQLTYALNAVIGGFEGNLVNYQNEQGNILCVTLPEGYEVVGHKSIYERNLDLYMLANETTGGSEIGVVDTDTCTYRRIANAECFGFNKQFPIHKIVYKLTNKGTEIYWTDRNKKMRFMDIDNVPYKMQVGIDGCSTESTGEIDCNQLSIQPNFTIPEVVASKVTSDGELIEGTYQFAAAYSNVLGEAYTEFYSVTNPLPIVDVNKITLDFNATAGNAIEVQIDKLDVTGFYDYFVLAVVKTINNISTPEIVGIYNITKSTEKIIYTGQNKSSIKLNIEDIFQKYPRYEKAGDITVAQDILIWSDLITQERVNYQKIWNKVTLQWQTTRIPKAEGYKDNLNAANLKGYMRDELYALEGVFILKNGYQTDKFHIPSRVANGSDLEYISNSDLVQDTKICNDTPEPKQRWQIYNTGSKLGQESQFVSNTDGDCYKGPYEYGEFAFWQSTETYPCNAEIWGDLAGKPIRHHKFPDNLITSHHDETGIYPIGIKIDIQQVIDLIKQSDLTEEQKNQIAGFKIVRGNRANNKSVKAKGIIKNVGKYTKEDQTFLFPNYMYNAVGNDPFLDDVSFDQDSKSRFTFQSPDTTFFQPFLGNILKIEGIEEGVSKGHFVQVKDHAKYRFPSLESYITSLAIGVGIGFASATIGVSTNVFSGTAAFTAFKAFEEIIYKLIPKKNPTYQFNSVGKFNKFTPIPNFGNKQRRLDIGAYLTPGMLGVGDTHTVNNYQRESSVYLRTTVNLPYPHEQGAVVDTSKWVLSENGCNESILERPISTYYVSIKDNIVNQYGQINSYESVDTGFYKTIDLNSNLQPKDRFGYIFGGDIYISPFAFKSKIPFFLDNRVGLNIPDESDIFYDTLGNVGSPKYWFSTDIKKGSGGNFNIGSLFGVKVNNFDCANNNFFYDMGKIYLFAYGIPEFYVESEVNVEIRRAFNNREGDFFPRVSSDIPDEWLQETNVSIQHDNSYYYNKTYSKQNKENFFSNLPLDFSNDTREQNFPFLAIFSEEQNEESLSHYRRNNWLIYRPSAQFSFPQNNGRLVSLEGLENRQVIARFENKSLLYNALLTAPTSTSQVYLGQSLFNSKVPPLDYSISEVGHMGTQNKFYMRTPYGDISVDAKRGDIFLIQGQQSKEIAGDLVDFFQDHMKFKIREKIKNVDCDNHFNGVGLHGVYDSKFKRVLITKLDYEPLVTGVTYSDGKYYLNSKEVFLSDRSIFCNRSFTVSFDLMSQSWISFHSYLPNFYLGNNNYFYAGRNNGTANVWKHHQDENLFNNFFGSIHPYILETPYSFQFNDEILQNIKDYTKSKVYDFNEESFVERDDLYFNKAILYNNQQCSGILELVLKPNRNLSQYMKYPIYNTDSKTIVFTKSDNFYNYNTFWSMLKDTKKPIWIKNCESMSEPKQLNQSNMDYSKRSFKKEPLRAKDLKVRHILDNRDNVHLISQFIVAETVKSYK